MAGRPEWHKDFMARMRAEQREKKAVAAEAARQAKAAARVEREEKAAAAKAAREAKSAAAKVAREANAESKAAADNAAREAKAAEKTKLKKKAAAAEAVHDEKEVATLPSAPTEPKTKRPTRKKTLGKPPKDDGAKASSCSCLSSSSLPPSKGADAECAGTPTSSLPSASVPLASERPTARPTAALPTDHDKPSPSQQAAAAEMDKIYPCRKRKRRIVFDKEYDDSSPTHSSSSDDGTLRPDGTLRSGRKGRSSSSYGNVTAHFKGHKLGSGSDDESHGAAALRRTMKVISSDDESHDSDDERHDAVRLR